MMRSSTLRRLNRFRTRASLVTGLATVATGLGFACFFNGASCDQRREFGVGLFLDVDEFANTLELVLHGAPYVGPGKRTEGSRPEATAPFEGCAWRAGERFDRTVSNCV